MTCVEVSGKIATRPSRRISAIEAQRIAIMTINVDRALTRPGSIVASSPGIVTDEGNDNSGLTSVILNVLHIGAVREAIVATASTGVLVLRLVQNDWTTIGDLCLGNRGSDVGGVAKKDC